MELRLTPKPAIVAGPVGLAFRPLTRQADPERRKDGTMTEMNERDEAIRIIRRELKRRSGKPWSVTGGRGTAWGWITIQAPPKRRGDYGYMTDEDRAELAGLLGLDSVHHQGVSIAASREYRTEYVDRARGLTPARIATPYWD